MSIDHNPNEKLWCEKYRPKKIEDCILKESTRIEFEDILKNGHIPNMLFTGTSGTGKTTAARALCNELGLDYTIINASEERGLDLIRDRIRSFASTVSMTGAGKCFILDEADHLLPATQAALRAASEEFSSSCSFIMTANYPNKIIDALHSRFVTVDFSLNQKEKENMQAKMFFRTEKILENEAVSYEPNVLVQVVTKLFPDNRKILNTLQQYGRHGTIDEGVLMSMEEISIDSLVESIKNRKFKDILKWCANNSQNDTSVLYEKIYKELSTFVKGTSIPDAITILEDGQRFDATVPSKELHLASVCVELMTTLEFK